MQAYGSIVMYSMLLVSNRHVKEHSKRPQRALVLWTHAILIVFKSSKMFSKFHSKPCYCITYTYTVSTVHILYIYCIHRLLLYAHITICTYFGF